MPIDELLDDAAGAAPGDLDGRLVQVFRATFPDLPEGAIPTASVETIAEWDSLQAVTLMTLLEEEFDIAISPLDLPDLGSYDEVREYLMRLPSR